MMRQPKDNHTMDMDANHLRFMGDHRADTELSDTARALMDLLLDQPAVGYTVTPRMALMLTGVSGDEKLERMVLADWNALVRGKYLLPTRRDA